MADGDSVSWLVIARGWRVVDLDGERFGAVVELVGDTTEDIFNGLVVATDSADTSRYVPAEAVTDITEGCVATRLDRAAVEKLEPYQAPPASLQISSEKAPLTQRLRALWPGRRSQS